ncbi:hypothetical protein D3C80_919850 [compost metagenome]
MYLWGYGAMTSNNIDSATKCITAVETGGCTLDNLDTLNVGHRNTGKIKIATITAKHGLSIYQYHDIVTAKALNLNANSSRATGDIIDDSNTSLLFQDFV